MQDNVANEIRALEQELQRATQRGQHDIAARLWRQVLERDPDHVAALTAMGQSAYREGNLGRARELLQHLVEVDGSHSQQWVSLALVCIGQKDEPAEEAAIAGALTADAYDLLGLILRASLLVRQGKTHAAAAAYGSVLAVAPPMERLAPELRPAVREALAYREQYDANFGRHLDDYLAPYFKQLDGASLSRFRESVGILTGRQRRYDSQSSNFHYHGLAPSSFFERQRFPWLDAIEAATDAIRDEFLAVLERDEGFMPYLTYRNDQPLNQWVELNNSPRWSAFHLIKDGLQVGANAGHCPATMAALANAPQPEQAGRTPSAMFSLLKPHTRIPPHTGVSNARLVVHLPLIVPENCGFRVGNDKRVWEPGRAWVFDDTIEHEAWNDSDKLRVVLIFDIWHPDLSEAERAMISALTLGINAFTADEGGYAL